MIGELPDPLDLIDPIDPLDLPDPLDLIDLVDPINLIDLIDLVLPGHGTTGAVRLDARTPGA